MIVQHQSTQSIIFMIQLLMKTPFCLVILLSITTLAFSEFIPVRTQVVDKNTRLQNYLVRGNLPISKDKKFQIKELKQQLSLVTGLEKYELVVISFLNFLTAKQTRNRYIEEKFFENHPEEGSYSTKLILGALIDPLNYPSPITTVLQFLSSILDIDNLDSFTSELHDKVHKEGRNQIIFFHCSAGMDRTGLVAGAYKIKYMNHSMKDIVQENSRFGGERKYMHFNALNGLKWFCLSVMDSRQDCIVE